MSIAAKDVTPFTQARANGSELADELNKNIHLLLLNDVKRGLADIAAGRIEDAGAAIARLQKTRKSATFKSTKQHG